MTKEKLEDLSLDRLRKRKKGGVVLLCIFIGIAILSIIILLGDFIGEKQLDPVLLVSFFACLVGGISIYVRIRKINGEICRRENK